MIMTAGMPDPWDLRLHRAGGCCVISVVSRVLFDSDARDTAMRNVALAVLRQLGFTDRRLAAVLGLTENYYVATLHNAAMREGSAALADPGRRSRPGKLAAADWRAQGVPDAETGRWHCQADLGSGPHFVMDPAPVCRSSVLGGEQDSLAQPRQPGPLKHLPLDHLNVVNAAFDGSGVPAAGQALDDGVEVLLHALAKDDMPGSSAARTSLIHCGRLWPVSWVSIAASVRIWSEAACSSGHRASSA